MKKKFIAFDIDGTYFRSHLFWEVALGLARKDILHPEINQKALELHESWRKRSNDKAFEEFDLQTVTKIKSLLKEIDPTVYDRELRPTLIPLLDHVYMWPKQLKEKLQKEGYTALAISGSRFEEVDIFAKHHNFDDWVGQIFHRTVDKKKYTGKVTATFDNKEKLLKDFVEKHNLTFDGSYAVGDTGSDISMLELVENPIAFNPNHSLLEHAQKKGWKIVIERKSIAYTLEKGSHGSYVLA